MTLTPTIRVEINFTGPETSNWLHLGDSARGILNTNTLGPDGDVWTDVTEYVYGFTIERGSRRVDGPVIRYEAGSATVTLDNSDRRFDPTNLSGPYVSGGLTEVEPMRGIRISADYNSIHYDLFRGFVDTWPIIYQQPYYSEVNLQATDGFKVLGNNNRAASGSVGAGEDSGARIARILNSVSWPAADRVMDTGDTTLQATTLEGDGLEEALLVADTEVGELYCDGAGRVVFRNRNGINEDTRSSVSQATFGDEDGELEYDDVTVEYDDTMIYNHVRITRVGGVEQVVSDSSSIAKYLTHTFERSDLLMQSDPDALDYANYVLAMSKTPELRFAELVVNPQGDTTFENLLYPQVLGREIGDRITVRRRPPGGGSMIERDHFIRGVKHTVDIRNSTWMTAWPLQAASTFSFLVLDHATLGKLDQNSLGF